ncbi:hypothetical protein Nepgr_000274 [Nepenthes gracilis]|uniref:Uncharacterized protein n=1 Tax=Nepenthes gracilis TaxID=150966 RepID=A0AAD3P483_NEPGR|nr:hypothetical protein Nepgr_000274 [Nepenthes gracilis]
MVVGLRHLGTKGKALEYEKWGSLTGGPMQEMPPECGINGLELPVSSTPRQGTWWLGIWLWCRYWLRQLQSALIN